MTSRTRIFRFVLCLCAVIALACPSFATQAEKQLGAGVSLFQDINTAAGSELIVNSVTIDPANPAVTLKAAVGKDTVLTDDPYKGRESISNLTARRGALIGVNADFFPFTGDPLGVCIIDGELVSEPDNHRCCLVVLKDHTLSFDNPVFDAKLTLSNGTSRQIDGINRERDTNQVVIYTQSFGAHTPSKYTGTEVVATSGDLPIKVGKSINLTVTEVRTDSRNTSIPKDGVIISSGSPAAYFLKENLKPGDKLSIQVGIKSTNKVDWSQVEQAVGGGPWLLKDGRQYIDGKSESFPDVFCTARHPRTAVGITADGKLMIVTVDGRQTISKGINLPDLASLMKKLGAVNAINLDGGGSTTLSYRGSIINSPSGGEQRQVADALLVFSDPIALPELPKLKLNLPQAEIAAGEGAQLYLTWGDDAQVLTPDQLKNVVWGTGNASGFVNQMGYLTPIKLRRGSVSAYYGSQIVSSDVKVIPGAPSNLDVVLIPDKTNQLKATATVTLTDVNGNPIAGKQVALVVTGGKADQDNGITNAKGEFTASITLDPNAAVKSVKASSGGLTASSDAKSHDAGTE